jgi:hypothetical protein
MLTAVWFFPIVMGAYGLASQRLVRHLVEGRASSIAEAARMSARLTGPLALIWMFPFLFLKFRSPFLVTVVAAVFWALLLVFFFMVIFPLL